MPDLNGLELFAKIRKMDPTARALLLTANHEQFIEGNKQKVGRDYLKVITKQFLTKSYWRRLILYQIQLLLHWIV